MGMKKKTAKKIEKKKVPLSEHERKYHENWGKKECIDELVKVAKSNPDRYISRNFFRTESIISDSTWNRYFGTFHEFRRQAELELNRGQHKLEREIAKHASVDDYKELNARHEYGENYLRDTKSKQKTVLVASDIHDIHSDRFWLRVFIDTAKRIQPDIICLNGDVFDLPEFGKYTQDPRDWDVVGRIKFVHEHILKPLREACPDTQIDLIEGNHEARLVKHLSDATPALRVLLSDLHNLTVRDLFGLDKFEVNYIAKMDLGAFTVRDFKKEIAKNYKIYYDCLLAHHFPYGKAYGVPGFNGHHHCHLIWSERSHVYGNYEWHQLGCGHVRNASYCDASAWNNGFLICHVDTNTKQTLFEYIDVKDFACVGGKFYYRQIGE